MEAPLHLFNGLLGMKKGNSKKSRIIRFRDINRMNKRIVEYLIEIRIEICLLCYPVTLLNNCT